MLDKTDTDILLAINKTEDEKTRELLIELMAHRQLVRRIKTHVDTVITEATKIDIQVKSEIHIDTSELIN